LPTFTPPPVADVPPILPTELDKRANPVAWRLFRYYHSRNRGINVFKMKDGTYVSSDPGFGNNTIVGEPYPATDAVPNNMLAQSYYNGVRTDFPLPQPIALIYYGGHSYSITSQEATNLTNAGYGAFIT